jgi:hypothetical protein
MWWSVVSTLRQTTPLYRVPTVLENPGKSLNLLKKNSGLESHWKLIRSLKVLEFFSVGWK